MYAAAKHFHMLAIVLSVLLFTVRYCLMMANSTLNEKKIPQNSTPRR